MAIHIRRREFVVTLGGAVAAWPLAARTQQRTEPFAEIQASDVQAAARATGQNVTILKASTVRDIDAAFASLAEMRADALLIATNSFFFVRAAQLVVLAVRYGIPTLYFRREFVAAGGLLSYGSDPDE